MVTETKEHTGQVERIALANLKANPYQPETRIDVDFETAERFGKSIQEHGLIMMPVVRPGVEEGTYEVGDGWLRLSGFRYLTETLSLKEYAEVPCVVRTLTDQQMADMIMEANTVRKDMNPIEQARFFKRYLEDFGITQEELAKRHNCTQGTIANAIRLLDLSDDLKAKIISQEISETHARQLLRLNHDPKKQEGYVKRVVNDGMSVNDLSNRIAYDLYQESKGLDPTHWNEPPKFDITVCEGCEYRKKLGSPYSSSEKQDRCTDPKCWKEKQKEAEAKMMEEVQAKIKEQGGDAVIPSEQLEHGSYQRLFDSFLSDHPECEKCEHRTAMSAPYSSEPIPICMDPKCCEAKSVADRKKAQEEEEQRLADRRQHIAEVVSGVTDMILAVRTIICIEAEGDYEFFNAALSIPEEPEDCEDIDVYYADMLSERLKDWTTEQMIRLFLHYYIAERLDSRWNHLEADAVLAKLEIGSDPDENVSEVERSEPANPNIQEDAPREEEQPEEIDTEDDFPVDQPVDDFPVDEGMDADEIMAQARAEVQTDLDSKLDEAELHKKHKCTACNKDSKITFKYDRQAEGTKHWKGTCECGEVIHITNRHWDGMHGIK